MGVIENYQSETAWIQRQEIRKHLAELVNQHPILLEVYQKEIHLIHPHLITQIKRCSSGRFERKNEE